MLRLKSPCLLLSAAHAPHVTSMFMVEDVEEPIQLRKVQRLVVPSHVSTAKWIQGHPRPGVIQVWRDAIDLTYGAGGSLDET